MSLVMLDLILERISLAVVSYLQVVDGDVVFEWLAYLYWILL